MKVVFFLGFPNPFPGAAWTRIGFFARHFREMGHDVSVLGTYSPFSLDKAGSRFWKGVRILNICPTTREFWVESFVSTFFNVISSIITVIPILLVLRPDVVVISVPSGEPAFGAYIASRLAGAKVVTDYRDQWEDFAISRSQSVAYSKTYEHFKGLMTAIYKRNDLVVTVTKAFARDLLSRGVRGTELVPNGADIDIFKPSDKASTRKRLGLGEDDFIIVYVGGIGGSYRLDMVVKAMARFDNDLRKKAKLLMVGPASGLPKVEELCEELGLESNVLYLGVKDDKEELAEIISSADIGVIPYDDNPLWKNTLPAKFFEYCACGVPVLAMAYEESMLSCLIKEHEVGAIVPPLDHDRLSEAIAELVMNPSRLQYLAKNTQRTVAEYFDRGIISADFLDRLRSLFEGPAG